MGNWINASLNDIGALTNFRVLPYKGTKPYLATLDVNGNSISPSEEVYYNSRPSRADIEIRTDDVLQAKMKATNKACFVSDDMDGWLVSTGFAQFKPKTAQTEPRYFYYIISDEEFLITKDRYCVGSTQQAISDRDLKNIRVRYNSSLKHQQKIAAILTTIDTAIEKTEGLIEKYRKIKTGLMNDLFTRGIGPDGKLRPLRSQAPELYKKTELGWIPKEWEVVALETCGDIFNGSTPSRPNTSYWGGEISWLSSGKINDYIITSPSEYVTKKALDNTSIKLVPKDSVLVGLIGQGRTRGMVAKLSIESTINQNLAAIVPFDGVSGNFIHQYLFKEYRRLRNVGRGSNQGALNCQIVRDFDITIPNQYKEQEIISKILLVIDEKIYKERTIISKLQKQKAGLMQDLLTGKVEVTVPEEEAVHG